MERVLQEKIKGLIEKISLNIMQFSLLQLARVLYYFNERHDNILKITYKDNLSLSFNGSEVSSICCEFSEKNAYITLSINILSIMGASGLLPSHYKLDLLAAQKNRNNAVLDFINIFHNILAGYYINLLMKYHPALCSTKISFKHLMQTMLGSDCNEQLLTDTRLFIEKDISKETLSKYLSRQTGCEINVATLTPFIHKFSEEDSTRFNGPTKLGHNTIIGKGIRVDRQHIKVNILADDNKLCVILYQSGTLQKKIKALIQNRLGYGYRIGFEYYLKTTIKETVFNEYFLLGVNCFL